MSTKRVPVYFYYITVNPIAINDGSEVELNWQVFLDEFKQMLNDLQQADLSQRKETFTQDEKVIWLDECSRLIHNEFDLIMKSAKYNHVRTVIDTSNMQEKGMLKTQNDGDEERTHLCLRYHPDNKQMLCLYGNNFYGVTIGKVLYYLTNKMQQWSNSHLKEITYSFDKEIMPGDAFIQELRKMDGISVVTLSVDKVEFEDDFYHLAGRDETKDTVDVQIKKAKRKVYIPSNLVENYYQNMTSSSQSKIKKIVVEGKNSNGSIKIDTESIQMKQSVNVELTEHTREIISDSFFAEAQSILDELRGNNE